MSVIAFTIFLIWYLCKNKRKRRREECRVESGMREGEREKRQHETVRILGDLRTYCTVVTENLNAQSWHRPPQECILGRRGYLYILREYVTTTNNGAHRFLQSPVVFMRLQKGKEKIYVDE
jgi:hypothetical protein